MIAAIADSAEESASVRIKIVQKPGVDSIDGIRLDHFRPGLCYDVGTMVASLLLAEGWAEPASGVEPALMLEFDHDAIRIPRRDRRVQDTLEWRRSQAADRSTRSPRTPPDEGTD